MRIKLLVIGLVLIAVSLPVYASPVNYTINFTTDAGSSPAPTSGSFTYDSSTDTFSNFVVMWDGYSFNLTSSANATFNHASGCTGEASTGAYSFELLSQALTCPSAPEYFWFGQPRVGPTQFFAFEDEVSVNGIPGYDQIGATLPETSTGTGIAEGSWTISAAANTPEPSGLLLLGSGLAGLMFVGLKRRFA